MSIVDYQEFPPVQGPRRSLAEEIRLSLREKILRGDLSPGTRIVEQEVARQMGTSQGPVREALAFLCQEGLLLTLPHRGTFVSEVSEAEARMAYQLRGLIEPVAVLQALDNADDAFIALLERLIADVWTAAENGDVSGFVAADMAFHGAFYELVGSDILLSVWRTISTNIRKFVTVAAPQYYAQALREAAQDHEVFLDLVRARDREAVAQNIAEHTTNIWRRFGTEAR